MEKGRLSGRPFLLCAVFGPPLVHLGPPGPDRTKDLLFCKLEFVDDLLHVFLTKFEILGF